MSLSCADDVTVNTVSVSGVAGGGGGGGGGGPCIGGFAFSPLLHMYIYLSANSIITKKYPPQTFGEFSN